MNTRASCKTFFGQFFYIIVRFGNASPKEHTYLIGIKATTEYFHNLFCQLAATAIYIDVRFFVPFHTVVVSLCGGQLHGAGKFLSQYYSLFSISIV